jgi:putative ABC transport system permease protein
MKNLPPKWPRYLLTRFHPEETLEEVAGDLEELYTCWVQNTGKFWADLRYCFSVITVLPPFVRRRKKREYHQPSNLGIDMLRNYFKIAFRSFSKQIGFTSINILGLSLGLSCCILIALWVEDEISIDKFHVNDERIFAVRGNHSWGGQDINTSTGTASLLAENLKKDFQEVEKAAVMTFEESTLLTVGSTLGKEKGSYASQDFLSIFSFPLAYGNPQTALKEPKTIVISKKLASKYFLNQNALGKVIRINNKHDLMVTGVLNELPANSSVKFDYLISWQQFLEDHQWAKRWDNNAFLNYVLLSGNADADKLSLKLKDYLKVKTNNETDNEELFLQKNSDSYLYSKFKNGVLAGGKIEYIQLFATIGAFILLIACINFMNLATARSARRAKEIGVRKVIGATRNSLMGQFISESMLTVFLALIIGVLITLLLLPQFNQIANKQLSLTFNLNHILSIIGIGVFTGFLSGLYPAVFLSSLKPVSILKGVLRFNSSETFFRKGLVVFQFSLSFIFIVGIIIIYQQLNYIQTKNLGYNRENLLYLPLEGDLKKSYLSFKRELLNLSGIKQVSCSWSSPLQVNNSTSGIIWPDKDTTQKITFKYAVVHYDYLNAMGISLKEGRDFSTTFGTDTSNYIINEEAARTLGYKDPVGKELTFWGRKGTIIGVMKNYHINSLHVAIEPLILQMQRKEFAGFLLIKTEGDKTKEALANIEKTFRQFNPKFPFEYKFTDQEFGFQYKMEAVISKLTNYFTFLAVFISCLGLFGLAIFKAQQRTKEIGVRKVLGASVSGIVSLLVKDFLTLIGIAILIGSPIAWYLMNQWLQNYSYKIDIEWWVFAIASLLAIGIALFTIGFQSVKAALVNPVRSLKID